MVFEHKPVGKMRQCVTNGNRSDSMRKLKAIAATALMLVAGMPGAMAQQPTPPEGIKDLPSAPTPNYTQPLYLRQTGRDFSKSRGLYPNPFAPYKAIKVDKADFMNTPRLSDLIKNGKIYLSLNDAIAIGIENNFDIAIARYNMDIADTDILRTKSGAIFRGVNSGLVTNTLGGTSPTLTSGGGPGGTSAGAGGVATGAQGIVSSTNGAGTTPVNLDPFLTGTLQWERATLQEPNPALYGVNFLNQNTDTYDFGYNQGFLPGTLAAFTFNNNRQTTNTQLQAYSPQLQSTFRLQLTQHLLQGFGPSVNGRFIVEAINDRRIVDSSFRQQLLFTINQIENIYWSLVSAYEDVQAKERALEQSKQLAADNRKQLQIGTMAPLDVVNADSSVATDQQSLISSQTNLEYQQLLMKQAIARNLNDPALTQAPVIPTDRISLIETREEQTPVEDLVQEAYANRPELEQGILQLKNNETTLKGVKNGLLPVVDLVAFYGGSALGGKQNPVTLSNLCSPTNPDTVFCSQPVPTIGYGEALQNTFNNSSPDKGIGVNITIPLRNRLAEADQARAMLEYRQSQMRLQQLYTQIRMQVINQQFALTNDRAQVKAAQAAREYAYQSLEAEQKKYRLGASTTANVLQQQRNLAVAENNVISAVASYAKDRSAMYQLLANTFQHYNINLGDAVTGKVSQLPTVPGLEAAPNKPEPTVPAQQDQLRRQQPQAPPPPPQPPQ
jgi:outer membrane protein